MQDILQAATPYFVELLATLLVAAMTLAATRFANTQAAIKAKTGLDIEAILREALHKAMTTGAQNAVSQGLTGMAAIEATVAHAKASTPDAIANLAPTGQVLANIAAAKLAQLVSGVAK